MTEKLKVTKEQVTDFQKRVKLRSSLVQALEAFETGKVRTLVLPVREVESQTVKTTQRRNMNPPSLLERLIYGHLTTMLKAMIEQIDSELPFEIVEPPKSSQVEEEEDDWGDDEDEEEYEEGFEDEDDASDDF